METNIAIMSRPHFTPTVSFYTHILSEYLMSVYMLIYYHDNEETDEIPEGINARYVAVHHIIPVITLSHSTAQGTFGYVPVYVF